MSQNAIQQSIHQLFEGQNLSVAEADAAMSQIMAGEATEAQIGAFLAALRMKGETVDEITGCASAMKRAATQVQPKIGDAMLIDVVGTGGDGTHTFNISTTSALVVAGSGIKVAKHGNRSVSSRSGAADVLTALGANVQLTAEQSAACIEDVGFTFLFAVAYHPAMRFAIGARRELAARTIFNILGPLTNPANATNLLVGAYDPGLIEPMATVLGQMGCRAAYVVHGADGLDELSITGVNKVSHFQNGAVTNFELDPADYGIARATLADIQGGDPADNAAITRGILNGEIHGPMRNAVLLNAGVALSTEDGDIRTGIRRATESIDSGAALQVLDRFVAKTQKFA